MMNHITSVAIGVLSCFVLTLGAAAQLPGYNSIPNFPEESHGFGVTADALGDGRFVAWDGDRIFVETEAGSGVFSVAAEGVPGDPAFIEVHPDGETALLGAGVNGDMYVVDMNDPSEPEAVLNTVNNFAGTWLNTEQFLFDRAMPNDNEEDVPELAILDISDEPEVRTVVADKGTWSAGVVTSACGYYAYTSNGMDGVTVRYEVNALREAFETETPLDWETDGVELGGFSTSGPSAHTALDTVIFGGSGNIQFVDGETGDELGTADPAGEGGHVYQAAYNRVTGRILVIGTIYSDVPLLSAWVSETPFEKLPFGDITRTGVVDAQDIQTVINVVLGIEDPDSRVAAMADVTRTGTVNAADIQTVINVVLGIE
ncbi:MAG: dockerin type I domain-containing protein [Candidatus Hydrogenedentota bacterium]